MADGKRGVLASLVTMHTSFYAFSFIGYLAIWLTLGSLTAHSEQRYATASELAELSRTSMRLPDVQRFFVSRALFAVWTSAAAPREPRRSMYCGQST